MKNLKRLTDEELKDLGSAVVSERNRRKWKEVPKEERSEKMKKLIQKRYAKTSQETDY